MNIYLFERTDRIGYDEYEGGVVIADTLEEAMELSCVSGSPVKVTILGVADSGQTKGEVFSAFNAG